MRTRLGVEEFQVENGEEKGVGGWEMKRSQHTKINIYINHALGLIIIMIRSCSYTCPSLRNSEMNRLMVLVYIKPMPHISIA